MRWTSDFFERKTERNLIKKNHFQHLHVKKRSNFSLSMGCCKDFVCKSKIKLNKNNLSGTLLFDNLISWWRIKEYHIKSISYPLEILGNLYLVNTVLKAKTFSLKMFRDSGQILWQNILAKNFAALNAYYL